MTTDLRRLRDDDADAFDDVEVNGTEFEDDEEPTNAIEREVKGELVQGKLAGKDIFVPPVKKWRASALARLREGDFESWDRITLADDDWDIWDEVDPTMEEIEDFFASINPGLGTDQGNSRASRRSRRTTRRR